MAVAYSAGCWSQRNDPKSSQSSMPSEKAGNGRPSTATSKVSFNSGKTAPTPIPTGTLGVLLKVKRDAQIPSLRRSEKSR
jgi:hypothetical protein